MDFWRRSVFCALSFLTILKLPPRLTEGADFSKSAYTFTAVGLVIGVGLMLVHLIFGAVAPFFMVLYLAVITGFLHIDGLADTFDALFSSRSRERMLEIMKDSRIGAMGAAAIILSLAGKFFAFTLLDSLWLMVLIPAISRFAMVVLLYRMPYVRKEGLGKTFSAPYKPDLFWQIIPVICLALLFTGPLKVGILIVAFIFIYQITEMWYQRKIGGITGDLTGALCEIMETGLFLTAAMIASQ